LNTTANYLIIHDRVFSTIRWPTLCAKLFKCNTTLFPEDDTKIYGASKSTAVFSRITFMSVPIFMDLQGFLVGRHFVMKEFAAFKDRFELFHYFWMLWTVEKFHQSGKTSGDVVDWESPWNTMGGWNGSIQHEISLQRRSWMQRRLMIKLLYTWRNMRNENGCGICSWMKGDSK